MFSKQWIKLIFYTMTGVVFVVVALIGCDGSGSGQLQEAEQADAEPAPTPTEMSALKRRDVPPAGVQALVTARKASGSPGSECAEFSANLRAGLIDSDPGSKVVAFCGNEMPTACTFCFLRFDPNQTIEVSFDGPEGSITDYSVSIDEFGEGELTIPPLVPPVYPSGEYRVTATQNGRVAVSTFSLSEPTGPRMLVRPVYVQPGETVIVFLAGFWPDQPISLYLYCQEADGQEFLTTLPPARADAQGIVFGYGINTQPDDPEGLYIVYTEPPAQGSNSFSVRY